MNLSLQRIGKELNHVFPGDSRMKEWPSDIYAGYCRLAEKADDWTEGVLYIAGPEILQTNSHPADAQAFLCCRVTRQNRTDDLVLPVTQLSRDALLNCVQEIFFRYDQLEHQLMKAVLRGENIQKLVDLITPFFDNELIIMNASFRVVAHSWEEVQLLRLAGLGQLAEDGTIPVELANFFRNDNIYRQVEHLKEPFWYEPSVFSRRVLCLNVFVQNEFESRIVLCEIRHALDACDEELLVFFSTFVRTMYRRAGLDELQPRADSFTGIMKRLLSGDLVNEPELNSSLWLHHWEMNALCIAACIIPDPAAVQMQSLAYYCDRLSESFPDTCAVEYEQKICMLAVLRPHYQSEDDLISRIAVFQREANFRAGYSNVFSGFEKLPGYYRQAEIALRIGMEENPMIWNHRFSKYRLPYIRSRILSELQPELLLPDEMKRLQRYDRLNGTEYVRTLQVYLEHNMNAVQAASALFIHRGTMVYRLKRLEEIGEISFSDPDQILDLQICFRFLAVTAGADCP